MLNYNFGVYGFKPHCSLMLVALIKFFHNLFFNVPHNPVGNNIIDFKSNASNFINNNKSDLNGGVKNTNLFVRVKIFKNNSHLLTDKNYS